MKLFNFLIWSLWQIFLDLKLQTSDFINILINISWSKNNKPLISWISWHSLHWHHTPLRGSGEFSFHLFFSDISNISTIPNTNISKIFAPHSTERRWRIQSISLSQIFQIFQLFEIQKHKYFRNICPTLHWEALGNSVVIKSFKSCRRGKYCL